MIEFVVLQEKLKYFFKDESLLQRALTHRSIHGDNNERLEFLGDAVLSFIVADELYKRYPELTEGDLSRVRSGLVNGDMLADLARSFELGLYLILGQGEIKSGGKNRDSILADALEGLIGAIYVDGGLEGVRKFILKLWDEKSFDKLKNEKLQRDPKSRLQEWLQARQMPLPTYDALVTGKAHEQEFEVVCSVDGLTHKGQGRSTNRRKAEQQAAQQYLEQLEDNA